MKMFWLVDHPNYRVFPCCFVSIAYSTVTIAVFVPTHSGGSAPEFNRVPFWKANFYPIYFLYQGTIPRDKGRFNAKLTVML